MIALLLDLVWEQVTGAKDWTPLLWDLLPALLLSAAHISSNSIHMDSQHTTPVLASVLLLLPYA